MTRNRHSASADDAKGSSDRPGPSPSDLRIMIIGDSITHCGEGDYTWRYRIWKWFKDQGLKPKFVGPYIGTQPSGKAKPPQPARVPSDPEPEQEDQFSGGYAKDCDPDFDSHHFGASGRQVAQARGLIADMIREYKPNMLLVFLGVNDMVWWLSDADGTIRSMKEFIDHARAVDPDIAFAIGNVPVLYAFKDGRPDLMENIPKYNLMIKDALPEWSTKQSPAAHVDVASEYVCDLTRTDSGVFDGLHPNARGDFQIARAFSWTLHDYFKLGSGALKMPEKIPNRDLSIPKNFKAEGAPMGVKVTWDPVYGGRYEVRNRKKGDEDWGQSITEGPRFDTTMTAAGIEYEYQIRTRYGDMCGKWSDTITAVSRHDTADPPKITKVKATAEGFDIEWEPPKGDWNISQYEILWFDDDKPGSFPGANGARGTLASITDLESGHRYGTIMTTWTDPEGGSFWGGGRPFRCGAGDPDPPKHLKVKTESAHKVKLSWTGSDSAAGYLVYKRDVSIWGSSFETDDNVIKETTHEIHGLKEPSNWEFCISAANGTFETEKSDVAAAPKHS